jgi:probable rRNA maturation factor
MRIQFFYQKKFRFVNQVPISKWLDHVAQQEKKNIINLNYIFTDDAYLLSLNKQFLHHNTLTDILTFDDSENKTISAEVYISIERVKDNTIRYGTKFGEELLRVIIHGLLHCCGYRDKSAVEKKKMRSKEDFYLRQFGVAK